VLLQVFHSTDGLFDARSMACWHPPQHDGRPFKMLDPIGAAAIEMLVNRLEDKALKCIDVLPNRKIDDDPRIGIRPRIGGAAALVDIAPYEPCAALRNAVYQRKIVGEPRHARIIDIESSAANVELCKMMIGWLLQDPAPLPPVNCRTLRQDTGRFELATVILRRSNFLDFS
jgi:hypothetical protein